MMWRNESDVIYEKKYCIVFDIDWKKKKKKKKFLNFVWEIIYSILGILK